MKRYLLALLCCGLIGLGIYIARRPSTIHQMPTWHVSCDRTKSKAQNEYDVIIVGGGFGGLSCGALLAKNGYKVCLVEKNDTVGGLCSSYKKEDFHFDYGAEDIGGLWERGAVLHLLHMLNLKKENFFSKNTYRIIINDTFMDVSYETMEQVLAKKFPKEEKAIHSFFSKGKSTVILRQSVRFSNFLGKSPQELDQYTKMCAQKLLEEGKKLIPELENASIIKIITPLSFEELIAIPQGSIYGFSNPKKYVKPFFKSPIKGLYLSSATCEGPSIESVIHNGILCSHDIMGWIENTKN